jgi:hypothetical protein
MPRPKYPLEALARLREQKAEDEARKLAEATRDAQAAERAREVAERRRRENEETLAQVRAAEREALARGELSAADLARAAAWASRAEGEGRFLASSLQGALAREQEARRGERAAKEQTELARANARVLAEDRARFGEGQQKQAEARDEEASFEAWRPKR